MAIELDRRTFGRGAAALAFAGLLHSAALARPARGQSAAGYGPLTADPAGLLDLPDGFSYRIVSAFGQKMDDGATVPDNADGMGCFAGPSGSIILVRNHELKPEDAARSGGTVAGPGFDGADGRWLPGGTTTLWLDARSGDVRRQYRSLQGTIRNCAGGITPWGSWLSCEENVTRAGPGIAEDHGWVFEVPSRATGLVQPVPLKAMGRFYHEAACVDPATGIVYMTEDRDDGLFYRFIPAVAGQLARGGKLQALALDGIGADTRNWKTASHPVRQPWQARWIDLDGSDSPADDLRQRGGAAGAALFARAEGLHMGTGEMYFCCTSGGAARFGQVFRMRPGRAGRPDQLELFFESQGAEQFNFGDNLTVAPNGSLVVCEDQYTEIVDNHLRIITPAGDVFPFARLRTQTELAGACFSPDGQTLFVNCYSPAKTLMIRGRW